MTEPNPEPIHAPVFRAEQIEAILYGLAYLRNATRIKWHGGSKDDKAQFQKPVFDAIDEQCAWFVQTYGDVAYEALDCRQHDRHAKDLEIYRKRTNAND